MNRKKGGSCEPPKACGDGLPPVAWENSLRVRSAGRVVSAVLCGHFNSRTLLSWLLLPYR